MWPHCVRGQMAAIAFAKPLSSVWARENWPGCRTCLRPPTSDCSCKTQHCNEWRAGTCRTKWGYWTFGTLGSVTDGPACWKSVREKQSDTFAPRTDARKVFKNNIINKVCIISTSPQKRAFLKKIFSESGAAAKTTPTPTRTTTSTTEQTLATRTTEKSWATGKHN